MSSQVQACIAPPGRMRALPCFLQSQPPVLESDPRLSLLMRAALRTRAMTQPPVMDSHPWLHAKPFLLLVLRVLVIVRGRGPHAAKPRARPKTVPFARTLGIPRCQLKYRSCSKGTLDLTVHGYLDLLFGRAGVAREVVRRGTPWALTFEIERYSCKDLDDGKLRDRIVFLLRHGAFLAFGAAPVCASLSRRSDLPSALARSRLGSRILQRPCFGKSDLKLPERMGSFLVDLALEQVFVYWVENPDSSYFWNLSGWEKELPPSSPVAVQVRYVPVRHTLAQAHHSGNQLLACAVSLFCSARSASGI